MIWAMILAAGESKRMGKPKLLLPFGEKTMIETVIDRVIQSKVEKILVVLGSNREKIEKKIGNLPLEIAVNPDFKEGMLSSVQRGLEALPEEAQAVLVFLGDQPSIPSEVIDSVINAFRKTGKGIVLPVYKGERGHPVLIDMKYRHEVENLNPEVGLRELVYGQPDDILEVEVDDAGILRDINVIEDYMREIKNKSKV
ncbi:MAG: nucleotidyltransferase family protein [Candidatus Aminicenantes bacterium]|nr:nucleotidyltransferase family protein [Candidatus Aminicenantes bacterium]